MILKDEKLETGEVTLTSLNQVVKFKFSLPTSCFNHGERFSSFAGFTLECRRLLGGRQDTRLIMLTIGLGGFLSLSSFSLAKTNNG